MHEASLKQQHALDNFPTILHIQTAILACECNKVQVTLTFMIKINKSNATVIYSIGLHLNAFEFKYIKCAKIIK